VQEVEDAAAHSPVHEAHDIIFSNKRVDIDVDNNDSFPTTSESCDIMESKFDMKSFSTMPTFPVTKLHFSFSRDNFTARIKEQTIQYNETKSWRMKEKRDATII